MITSAIILAVVAAFCLAFGTHFQQHAVSTMPPGRKRSLTWVTGLGLMGMVTILNVIALGLGPVSIVQPIGAISLVVAAFISSRYFGLRLGPQVFIAIGLTIFSIFAFVTTSANFAHELRADDDSITYLLALLMALSVFGILFALSRAGHIARILMTGIIFGTVAAATHVLARSFVTSGLPGLDLMGSRWWILLLSVACASAVGFWLVQTAYACGPAETVLAGLTVIDPIVAVTIGGTFFGEYAGLTPSAVVVLLIATGGGICGVWMLAKFHPTNLRPESAVSHGTDSTSDGPLLALSRQGHHS